MRAVFVTDLHGNSKALKKVLKYSESEDIEAVIIGGDIGPFAESFSSPEQSVIQDQREFLENVLVPEIEGFRKKHKDKKIFVMMGNDDFRINMDILQDAEKRGLLKIINKHAERINDMKIVGYSYVSPMPFLLDDWEKDEKYIDKDLRYLLRKSGGNKGVWVFHDVPFGTKLDVIHGGRHVGSRSIRRFIEEFQPSVTLHGHIHESPDITGSVYERIGKTISINPGNRHFVIFDMDDPEDIRVLDR